MERDQLQRARLWTDGRVWVLSEKTDQALNPRGVFGAKIGMVERRKGRGEVNGLGLRLWVWRGPVAF